MIQYSTLCQTALESIGRNKTRSVLTTLGVIIGVLAVILLTSIGNGLRAFVADQFESLGANSIYVTPGELITEEGSFSAASDASMSNSKLKTVDADKIIRLGGPIKTAIPYTESQGDVRFGTKKRRVLVVATYPEYEQVRNTKAEKGRFFNKNDEQSKKKVAVIGPETAEKLFGKKDPVGKSIIINKVKFKIIGVAEEKGGSFGGGNFDDLVLIPFSAGQSYLEMEGVSSIIVQARSAEDIPLAIRLIERSLLRRLDEDDFAILDQNELLGTIDQILGTLTAGLTGIAAISLLVGGIGIMNIMLVSVTERTREIGLRKALGATPSIIMLQFLIEAAILSSLGGAIGIILGFLATFGIRQFIPASVTLPSVLLAFGVSFAVGLIFGALPARRAARLSPIEALRHE